MRYFFEIDGLYPTQNPLIASIFHVSIENSD
jgi:hypothetical protein